MSLDLSIRDLIVYAQTSWGRVILQGLMVFVISEFVFRGILKSWIGFLMKKPPAFERLVADTVAFVLNVMLGCAVSWFVFIDKGWYVIIEKSWWVICVSVLSHFLYVKYLDKLINKKYGLNKK